MARRFEHDVTGQGASGPTAAPRAASAGNASLDGPRVTVESRLLTGWGRTAPSRAAVSSPADAGAVQAAVTGAGDRGIAPRGLGRSYGDAAQNAGGEVVDVTALRGIRALDSDADLVTVGAGTSLSALTRALVPRGRFLPVLPGTGQVTVGGAIACDIHGKSHHHDGGFAAHVASFDLVTPDGRDRLRVTPDGMPDVFAATAGGMGLTGVVVEATLRLLRIESSRMLVDTERAEDLDDAMARLESGDPRYRYSVAWIDCLASGRRLGRSVLSRGDHAPADAAGTSGGEPLTLPDESTVAAPPWAPSSLLRPATIRLFNEAWFRKSPREERGHRAGIREFFHPLDGIGGWNRLYGRNGMLQYQFVVPFGADATVRAVLERLASSRCPSFLGVLKRLGPESGPLSFPMPGWTLALDMPAGSERLGQSLDELDDLVAEAGGRVYLAKDSRLRPELLARMYPRLDEWRSVRDRLDPDRRMRSDLSRRLGL